MVQFTQDRAADDIPGPISCYEAGYDGFWLHRLLEATAYATMLSILQVCRLTVERAEPDRRHRRRKTALFTDGIPARRAEGLERCACTKCR